MEDGGVNRTLGRERTRARGSGCGWWGPSCSGRGPTGAFGGGVGRSLGDQGSKEQVLGTEDSGERERGAEEWWQREGGKGQQTSGSRVSGDAAGQGEVKGVRAPRMGDCSRSATSAGRDPIHRALGWEGRLQGVRESLANQMTTPTS